MGEQDDLKWVVRGNHNGFSHFMGPFCGEMEVRDEKKGRLARSTGMAVGCCVSLFMEREEKGGERLPCKNRRKGHLRDYSMNGRSGLMKVNGCRREGGTGMESFCSQSRSRAEEDSGEQRSECYDMAGIRSLNTGCKVR